MPKFRVSPSGEYQIADSTPIESAPHVRIYPSAPIVLAGSSADQLSINPPIPGLSADNVQNAIEELAGYRGIAAQTLSGHRAVTMTDSGIDYADNRVLAHSEAVLGITTHAAMLGSPILIQSDRTMTESSWNWSRGDPIFLGEEGLLTQIAPIDLPALFCLVLGFALSPTVIQINVDRPIHLI